ncbi:MAG: InlB B-repeat-containing protein, partial [Clostridiales Family XIII bacterium]|nr:InlB B-repeat-containing protein [Clostridiales Family XIII bacterium]
MKRKLFAYLLVLAMALSLFIMPAYAAGDGEGSVSVLAVDPEDAALAFDSGDYNELSITVDGQPMTVREYSVVYVASPTLSPSEVPDPIDNVTPGALTVTYAGGTLTDGGTPPTDPNTYNSTQFATVLGPADLEKTGYTFIGWAETDAASVPLYVEGVSMSMSAGTVKTLYPVWQDDTVNQYRVFYIANGNRTNKAGGGASAPTSPGGKVTLGGPGPNAAKGYSFNSWSLNPEGTNLVSTGGEVEIGNGNVYAYATWSQNQQYGYQRMNIYVPETASDASPIYFSVQNSGWNSSPSSAGINNGGTYLSTSTTGYALQQGYLIANVGTRSRDYVEDVTGALLGKSPTVIADAKSAIRYLRLNDTLMPGSAERIILNGTSGGGGVVVAVGASGNSPDYYPYLQANGAAGIDENGNSTLRADVYAVVGYCPISDLPNADLAYEWVFNSTRQSSGNPTVLNTSAELAAAYPAYLASLNLKLEDGTPLTTANMEATIIKWLEAGFVKKMNEGITIPEATWADRGVTVSNANKTAVIFDFEKYKAYVAQTTSLKGAPAFDSAGVNGNSAGSGESSLFGRSPAAYWHFTKYGWEHDTLAGNGIGLDDNPALSWEDLLADTTLGNLSAQIKMVDPLPYIGTAADTAPYWYIRHGGRDRDTVWTVSIDMYYKLRADSDVKDVNYALAYDTGHDGGYDAPEVIEWLKKIVAAAGSDLQDAALAFDTADYDTLNVTIDGAAATVKKYSEITYVADPVNVWLSGQVGGGPPAPVETRPNAWEMLNVYVPQDATDNSAIILVVNNGGWMNSSLGDSLSDGAVLSGKSDSDKYGAALKAGYVVVEIGTRSRGIEGAIAGATAGDVADKDGTYPGKAPAVVVDTKAAIRYLRQNDAVMPGSAERIVITGTSGGGGLSTAVAASGNAKEYLPYLEEIGAAGIAADGSSTLRDDVFGTIAYCPITDLNNADAAYEWTYNAVRTDANTTANAAGEKYGDTNADSIDVNDASMAAASKWLANSYIAYFNGLGLKNESGAALTTNNLAAAIQLEVTTEIQETLIEGGDPIPNYGENFTFEMSAGWGSPAVPTDFLNDWFKYDPITKKVTAFYYDKYLTFVAGVTTLKAVPAFDNTGIT